MVVIFVRQTRKNVFARNPTYKPYVISSKSGLTQYHAQKARPKKEKCRHGVIPRSLHLLFLLVEIVSLLEFVDASACVNKFLFAREVRMALGANFNTKFVDVLGGTGLECVSACTHDCYVMVLGMDSFFHFDSPDSFFYTHTRQYVTRI